MFESPSIMQRSAKPAPDLNRQLDRLRRLLTVSGNRTLGSSVTVDAKIVVENRAWKILDSRRFSLRPQRGCEYDLENDLGLSSGCLATNAVDQERERCARRAAGGRAEAWPVFVCGVNVDYYCQRHRMACVSCR